MQTLNVEPFTGSEPLTIEPHAVKHGVLEHDVKAKGSLAPSATMLTVSNNGEENYPFDEVVKRIAEMKLGKNRSNRVISKTELNRDKLFKSILTDYRKCFSMIYTDGVIDGKVTGPKPVSQAITAKIWEAVHRFIDGEVLSRVNHLNSTKISVSYKPDFRNSRVDAVTTITGKDTVDYNRQIDHLVAHLAYLDEELTKRVNLNAKAVDREPDYAKETAIKERIGKFEKLIADIRDKKSEAQRALGVKLSP